MQFFTNLLDHYGYVILFSALLLELLALPFPGELLMSYAGLLIYEGKLDWGLCIAAAGTGSSIGMTIAYWIGYKLGFPFFEKYGAQLHFGPHKLHKMSVWFEKYGNNLLLISYFIMGVRHITGYFSGITRLPFRSYMIYAYSGAFIWAGVFISLGRLIGPKWQQFHHSISKYLLIAALIAAVLVLSVYIYRKNKTEWRKAMIRSLYKAAAGFHSFGRVKFIILSFSFLFVALFSLMVGLIQDVMAGEFSEFDEVASFIFNTIFDKRWTPWMERFGTLSSREILIGVIVLTFVGIVVQSKDRLLETRFLLLVTLGAEIWDEALRRLFHRMGPMHSDKIYNYSFPNEQTFITIVVYGFAAFLLVRHLQPRLIQLAAVISVIVVSVLVGLNPLYFHTGYPSDIVAGYVFGGVWVSLNVILLEIFRYLRGSAIPVNRSNS